MVVIDDNVDGTCALEMAISDNAACDAEDSVAVECLSHMLAFFAETQPELVEQCYRTFSMQRLQ